jgi:subtilisin family serine protease
MKRVRVITEKDDHSTGILDLVRLTALMDLTSGSPEVSVGLIDGPVVRDHADLAGSPIRELPAAGGSSGQDAKNSACLHGTFLAGILSARRGSDAPAICPACPLLVRPIYRKGDTGGAFEPSTTPDELAAAIFDCIRAGTRVINLSLALVRSSASADKTLQSALDAAMRRGVIIVAAAGNQNIVGSTLITRHPWVIPTAACDREGLPSGYSNLGLSIGARGLRAPGDGVISTRADGQSLSSSGTSVAAPFVTGTVALLWSTFPSATAAQVKLAVTQASKRRISVVPPLLDAWAAYQTLAIR